MIEFMRVVVIGAGIAGAATAYQLLRRGAEVVLADADLPGRATSAGAGIVCPWTARNASERDYRFAVDAGRYYPTLLAELAEDGVTDLSYATVGALVLGADDSELRATRDQLAARATEAPEAGAVELLDPARARELFPPLARELGAVRVAGGARVDGRLLRDGLLHGVGRRGGRILHGAASLVGGRVTVDGEPLAADAIVLAAGAWTDRLLEPLGVRLGIEPQRGQISHFDLPGADTANWPVLLPRSSHYLLAFPGSRVVAGATRETGAGFDYRVTAAGQREVLDNALAVAPGLAGATLAETRVGFRPASPDGAPVIGRLGEHPQVVVVTGFGPAGLTLAPYAGTLAAALALGEHPEAATPFRPQRG